MDVVPFLAFDLGDDPRFPNDLLVGIDQHYIAEVESHLFDFCEWHWQRALGDFFVDQLIQFSFFSLFLMAILVLGRKFPQSFQLPVELFVGLVEGVVWVVVVGRIGQDYFILVAVHY